MEPLEQTFDYFHAIDCNKWVTGTRFSGSNDHLEINSMVGISEKSNY